MSTKENNKLISEFMGYENVGTLNNPMYDYYDNDFQDGIYKVTLKVLRVCDSIKI